MSCDISDYIASCITASILNVISFAKLLNNSNTM